MSAALIRPMRRKPVLQSRKLSKLGADFPKWMRAGVVIFRYGTRCRDRARKQTWISAGRAYLRDSRRRTVTFQKRAKAARIYAWLEALLVNEPPPESAGRGGLCPHHADSEPRTPAARGTRIFRSWRDHHSSRTISPLRSRFHVNGTVILNSDPNHSGMLELAHPIHYGYNRLITARSNWVLPLNFNGKRME